MGAQVLAYPFLFIALFLEAFLLVTFLSDPARRSRTLPAADRDVDELPSVAIVVPCWNEEGTIGRTADSLLALDYPVHKLQIILVDDGSTDGTPEAMAAFADNPRVRIVRKENGGKYTAINVGVAATEADIVGCLDADSFVDRGALRAMIPHFNDPKIAATTAAMSVHQPKNLLGHMQHAEYILGIARANAMAVVHGIHVTPGPFSLYRRAVVVALGGFRHAYQTEDLEMALRLQRAGYKIANAVSARVYTKAPATVATLVRQRTRWTTGFLRNLFYDYRDLLGSPRYGALGLITLPLGALTIGSGILLFALAIFQLGSRVALAAQIRLGIPLSYALTPHGGFDWFYLPASVYTLLSACAVLGALALITLGKKASRTPGSLAAGMAGYVLLYGILAPLWLIRSTYDVALGKKRAWR